MTSLLPMNRELELLPILFKSFDGLPHKLKVVKLDAYGLDMPSLKLAN